MEAFNLRECSLPSINIRASPKLCPQNAGKIPPSYVFEFPQYTMHLPEFLRSFLSILKWCVSSTKKTTVN